MNDDRNSARLWRPAQGSGAALFKAAFTTFAYERHTHEEYALGVIEQGVQRFGHKGASYVAPPLSMYTINPDEVHDGAALSPEGYRYRMIYLDPGLVRDMLELDDSDGGGLLAFDSPQTTDPELARRLLAALRLFDTKPERMDEVLPPVLRDLFTRYATPRTPTPPKDGGKAALGRVLDYIEANADQNPSLDELALTAGLSKYHFLRVFKRETGLSPHAYLLGRRVEHARKALERGVPPSEAALLAGFADQSHLTRRFKAFYGVTPGALARTL